MIEQLEAQVEKLRPFRLGQPLRVRSIVALDQEMDRNRARLQQWAVRTAQIVSAVAGVEAGNRFRQVAVLSDRAQATDFVQFANRAGDHLDALIEDLKEHGPTAPVEPDAKGSGVFIVHGHDEGAREKVARYLQVDLKLDVTILQAEPHGGRTIAEKLEDYGRPAFAVVIVSPDDEGRVREPEKDDHEKAALEHRARQNVILELGYFWGLLGRSNVCVLRVGEVNLPSDVDGVGWIPVDPFDGWKAKLRAELKLAGIVD